MQLAKNGSKERARVRGPLPCGTVRLGNEGAGHFVGVKGLGDLAEQVPAEGTLVERRQNPIAALGFVESAQVPAVGIGNDRAVATREGTGEQLVDRGRLAGPGRADELAVLGFVCGRQGPSGQCDRVATQLTATRT